MESYHRMLEGRLKGTKGELQDLRLSCKGWDGVSLQEIKIQGDVYQVICSLRLGRCLERKAVNSKGASSGILVS